MATTVGEVKIALKFDSKQFDAETKTVQKKNQTLGDQMASTWEKNKTKILAACAAIGAAITKMVSDALKTGTEFSKNMSQVAATLGYTTDELGDTNSAASETMGTLRQFAKEMGSTTVFSAREASQALNYMALAGYDAATSMKMLPNVLNLAAAGGIELAYASDMVTDAQTALGLTLEETNSFVDQMAKTASRSNTSVSQLGEAILTVGGTAKYMSGGTKELNAVLGVMADNGIKGSEAGTHLRNMLLQLSSPTNDAKNLLSQLGVSVFDAEGNMRSFSEIFPELNNAMADFTDEQKLDAFSTLFNVRDIATANALLGTTKDRWAELGSEIGNSAGAAEEMAKVQLDNLSGDVTLMQSAFEGLQIALSEKLEPALRPIIQKISEIFTKISSNESTMNAFLAILGALAIIVGVTMVAAFTAWAVALWANPITWIVAGVVALVAGLIWLYTELEVVRNIFNAVFSFIKSYIEFVVNFWKAIFTAVINVISDKINSFKAKFESIFNAIKSIVTTAVNIIRDKFQTVKDFVTGVANNIKGAFDRAIEGIKNAITGVKETFSRIFGTIGEIIKKPINGIIGGINKVIEKINSLQVPDWVPGIGGAHTNFPTIPMLASGGITTGATQAIIGEAGTEAVLPLDRNTGNWSGLLADTLLEEMAAREFAGAGFKVEMNNYINNEMDADEIGRRMMTSIRRAI